ncbi:diguanylate cyclase, partial [Sphingomonas sp.]|uniref:diguanylate cyclase n=1 Tax=Sphingomonas sp. TaxID=28214 RepID=UPI00258580AF
AGTEPPATALLLFDTDRFKRYNDLYGHLAGDRVLKAIAGILLREVQGTSGLACRIGGEEFALILSGTTEADTLACAERVRRAVAAESIPHAGQDHGVVTVSCGVVHTARSPDLTPEQWYKAADVCLYEAKQRGRNRVEVAGWVPEEAGP